jgi:hypothetical protein
MAIRLMTEIMAAEIHHRSSVLPIHHLRPDVFLMKMFQLVPRHPVMFLLIISKHVLSYVAVVLVALGSVVPGGASGTSR